MLWTGGIGSPFEGWELVAGSTIWWSNSEPGFQESSKRVEVWLFSVWKDHVSWNISLSRAFRYAWTTCYICPIFLVCSVAFYSMIYSMIPQVLHGYMYLGIYSTWGTSFLWFLRRIYCITSTSGFDHSPQLTDQIKMYGLVYTVRRDSLRAWTQSSILTKDERFGIVDAGVYEFKPLWVR